MASVNKVLLIGYVGGEPEKKDFQNGGSIVTFNLATSEHWKDKTSGEKKERTHWHRIVVKNENIQKIVMSYVKKGSQVCVEGMLYVHKYTDQQGVEKTSVEVHLPAFNSSLTLLDPKGKRDEPSEDSYGDSY